MSRLNLQATLQLTDRISRPLKAISDSAKRLKQDIGSSNTALKALQNQMNNANGLTKMRDQLRQVKKDLAAASQSEKSLAAAIAATDSPTKAQIRNLDLVRKNLIQLNQQQDKYRLEMRRIGKELRNAGFDTRNWGESQRILQSNIDSATSAIARQRAELRRLNETQKQVDKARKQFTDAQQNNSNMRSTGYSNLIGGGVIMGGLNTTVDAANHYELQKAQLQVTGAGDKVLKDALHLVDTNKVNGISKLQALEVFKEGQIIMRNPHEVEQLLPDLLKSKYVLETLYQAQGHQNASGEADTQLRDMIKTIELRGGTTSVAAFKEQQDFMMKAILGSGGVLKSTDWLDAIKTGGVATKMMNNEAFYYVLGHMIQESGGFRSGTGAMSAFSNLTLGRTTQQAAEFLADNGLINKNQVIYGKTGHITKVLPGAMKSADLLNTSPFEWLMKELVPKLNPDGKLTDNQLKLKIAGAFSSRTAGNSFVQMYTDRANIARQLEAYRGSYNTQQAYDVVNNTTAGQMRDARAKYETLKIELGTQLLPLFNKALTLTIALVKSITHFTEKHPQLTKAILTTAAVFGTLMIASGALLIVLATILAPLLHLRLGLALLRITFGGSVSALGSMLGMLKNTVGAIGSMTGALGILAQAALVFTAAYAGWKIGGAVYDYQNEHGDPIGKSAVEVMAFFGSDNAKRMKAMGFGFSAPVDENKTKTTPLMLRGVKNPNMPKINAGWDVVAPKAVATQPIPAQKVQQTVTNHFAAPQITVNGVTDPKQVGMIVDQKLQQFQTRTVAAQNRSFADK